MHSCTSLSRRKFLAATGSLAGTTFVNSFSTSAAANDAKPFQLNYILGSPMYGTTALAAVIDEAPKIGAKFIDAWPRSHANHREQMDELGHDKVAELVGS